MYFYLVSCLLMASSSNGKKQKPVVNDGGEFSFANFNEHLNSYLEVQALVKTMEPNLMMCWEKCMDEFPSCLSINAGKKDSADSIYKTWCELLSDDKFKASDKFNFNTSSNHYSIPNPCDQLKCANGGKCRANYGGNTGKCQCGPGFTGETCDTDAFDDCASAPCKNNGTCQDIGNSYICTCAEKFAGKNCTLNCTVLGMEDRRILDSQITGSSSLSYYWAPAAGRLRNSFKFDVTFGCWRPASAQVDEYLQVDLLAVKNISKVATQGQPYLLDMTHWVTRYALSYSLDGVTWTTYPHEFPGNTDIESVVSHLLPVTIQARYIRFVVKAWNVNPAMRVEIYECGA